jgi:hypothetical protein
VQPEEAIRLATRLLDDPNAPEIDCRAAAHLAYYAVYHLVCDHFRIEPYTSHDEGKHKAVRDRLRAFNPIAAPPEIKEAKRVFDTLFKLRVRADYEWNGSFDAGDAEDMVERAKGVFARIPKPALSPPKSQSSGLVAPHRKA